MTEVSGYAWLVPVAPVLLGLGLIAWDAIRHRWTRRRLGIGGAADPVASERVAEWLSRHRKDSGRRLRARDFVGFGAAATLASPIAVAALVLLDAGQISELALLLLPLPITAWWLELRDRASRGPMSRRSSDGWLRTWRGSPRT